MKVLIPVNPSTERSDWLGQAGFTVTEIMVASVVFLFVIGGVMTAHYFGLSMYGITQERLGASDATRNEWKDSKSGDSLGQRTVSKTATLNAALIAGIAPSGGGY